MSIGYQKFCIPRKYQNQIGIWYFYPKFLGIFLVFYRHFENAQCYNFGYLTIGIFGRIKIGLVFGFCGCHFIGIGLVLVCYFPENDSSTANFNPLSPSPSGVSSGHERWRYPRIDPFWQHHTGKRSAGSSLRKHIQRGHHHR